MAKQIQIYGFLVIVAALSWWLVQVKAPQVEKPVDVQPHSAEFFSTGYQKLEMDATGKPKSKLIASKMLHYGDDNTTELADPVMTFIYPDASNWVVGSESGWISSDGKDMHLKGRVSIDRNESSKVRPIHVKTSELRVKPEKRYAETDQWVEINNPPDRTEGVGMQIYFSSPIHLKLLSNVRGRYETH